MKDFEQELKKYEQALTPNYSELEERVHAKVFDHLDAQKDDKSVFKLLTFVKMIKNSQIKLATFILFAGFATVLPLLLTWSQDRNNDYGLTDRSINLGQIEDELEDSKSKKDIILNQEQIEYFGEEDTISQFIDSRDNQTQPSGSIDEDTETAQAERAIEKNGTLTFKTRYIEKVFNSIQNLPNEYGGYIVETTYRGETKGSSLIRIRIPVGHFDQVVNKIKGMNIEIVSENIRTTDKQNELTELLAVQENYLEEISTLEAQLEVASEEDKVSIQSEINLKESMIDSNVDNIEELEKDTQFSTLNITMWHDSSFSILDGDFNTIVESIKIVAVFWGNAFIYISVPVVVMFGAYRFFKGRRGL